jgi:cyclase
VLKHRVIPALLLRDGGLVKTRQFKDPKYVGDPINAIRIFNDKEVDELMVMDIVASKRGQEPDYETIELFAGECFMPLCYGGGVRSVQQAARIFDSGVEKICLQSAALDDLSIIAQIAERFGSQSVVVAVDVKRSWLKAPFLYESRAGRAHNLPWLEFMTNAVAAGAGEVLLTSVDRDGTMQGMDLELIRLAANNISVPLVALGGVGNLNDIKTAVKAGASAVAAGAFFVFHGPHRAVLITYPAYRELEALLSGDL